MGSCSTIGDFIWGFGYRRLFFVGPICNLLSRTSTILKPELCLISYIYSIFAMGDAAVWNLGNLEIQVPSFKWRGDSKIPDIGGSKMISPQHLA